MNTFGERIKKARQAKGLSQAELAKIMGESSGNVIFTWEKGTGKPDYEKIALLCDVLEVSADDIIGRKKKILMPDVSEWSLIKKYRVLDAHGKKMTDFVVDSEYERVMEVFKDKIHMRKMKFYNASASAGTGNYIDSDDFEIIEVPDSDYANSADYIVSVNGDSMEPTFHNGDKVFIKKQDSLDIGDVGVFYLNGDVFIKELGRNMLISHNSEYKNIPLHDGDTLMCYGKVLGRV